MVTLESLNASFIEDEDSVPIKLPPTMTTSFMSLPSV